ncbi:Exopolyphosphatase [Alteripontixanthobacter maritimus]|uniref:Exopolyphosphatase n=1 Tax=Alteripontixanthobacter maritimus TaxID=2161824 RepID=A0A369QAC3_9SPHN|nr:exopolyphosphatase [Alteripontixanthobacter maritimus]RDC60495.1 Exopolyphosphatase [Alteripontixanthobacter maritimus]
MSQTSGLRPAMQRSGRKTNGHNRGDRRAIIDIGSNTVRLVVFGGALRAPRVIHNEKVTARLGSELEETGRIGAESWDMALAGLRRFVMLLEELETSDVETVATAAVRDAANGPEFAAAVRELGLDLRVLTGEQEAQASAVGVSGAFPGAEGVALDLGGGSLEIVEINADGIKHGVSLPLGTLRLPAIRASGEKALAKRLRQLLAASGYKLPEGRPLYLVGGALRAFGRYVMLQTDTPLDDAHGFEFSAKAGLKHARTLSGTSVSDLSEISAITSSRLAMLPDAAALLEVLFKDLDPARIVISAWGLREGLLFGRLEDTRQAQDPLIAGVSDFTQDLAGSLRMATMVAGWSSQLRGRFHPGDERVRVSAILLSFASQTLEPNLRRKQVLDWALHKRWIALSAEQRGMLGAALLAQTGKLSLPSALTLIASDEALKEAQVWGLATRLCRRFAGCSIGSIVHSKLLIEDDMLTLRIDEELSPLRNAGTDKDLANLAAALGVNSRIEMVEDNEA